MTQPAQYISGRTVQEQMDQLIGYVDTRAAEVATDAIASDVAQVHQDMLDADADASAAAASAAAAAGTLANAVKKTGESSQSIEGDVSLGTGDLSVAGDAAVQGQLSVIGGCDLRAPVKIPVTPTNNDDAASKKYVDDSLDNYAPMVRTTGNQSIAGWKTMEHLSQVPHMAKASSTYYRWFSVPKIDGTYYLTASIATRTASFIQQYVVTVASGAVSSVTKTNMCSAGTNTSIKVGAFSDTDNIYVCIHLDANNQYVCPVMLGLHGNYGDVVTITQINQFNTTIEADYTEVQV